MVSMFGELDWTAIHCLEREKLLRLRFSVVTFESEVEGSG